MRTLRSFLGRSAACGDREGLVELPPDVAGDDDRSPPADVQTLKLYRALWSKMYPPRMNTARLTVMWLRS
jgi:hypothetical protein